MTPEFYKGLIRPWVGNPVSLFHTFHVTASVAAKGRDLTFVFS